MFSGHSNHRLDDKGRLIIPARYRTSLGEKFYILRSIHGDECIWIMPEDEYNELIHDLSSKIQRTDIQGQRWLKRILASSFLCEEERQGRVLIQQNLRDSIGLEDADVTLVGVMNHIEIWSSAKWKEIDEHDFLEDTMFVNSKYGV